MDKDKTAPQDIRKNELYTLYIHTCLENDKVYVGITNKDAKKRWIDGSGYKSNYELYSDILKYSWDKGFHHKVVADNLTWEKAKEAERFFIDTFDSTNPEKGYNHRRGGIGYGAHRNRANVGTKIQVLRKNKHITQQQLADDLNLSRATISNYEVNRRSPSIDDLKLLADYFGVGLDYFGTEITNASFEISSRVIEYFKNENISLDDKIELFNDILSAYYIYVIESK